MSTFKTFGQSFEGSWQLVELNGETVTNRKVVKTVVDGYFALGSKSTSDNSFLGAAGGEFQIKEDKLIENRDFDTYDASKINEERVYELDWVNNDLLKISDDNHEKIWKRLSNENNSLSGNWVITGRMRNDEMRTMTPGDRRTIKILNGNRFQWVAFNSASKTFNASGGGTYSAEDGTYVENITFFSKNKDRVGAELQFQFEVIDGAWHHKGNSSKGDPIHEIWSPYAEAYNK
ncbi:hypothetical protein [Psychroflexus tropicus]|uniref:hypothetical protein n=1 Tax=Psychroflexus tropicus TaxID=197345 RepID=UPI0003A91A03|nr:hypothetical protein [Psychroflexus tropicus]